MKWEIAHGPKETAHPKYSDPAEAANRPCSVHSGMSDTICVWKLDEVVVVLHLQNFPRLKASVSEGEARRSDQPCVIGFMLTVVSC